MISSEIAKMLFMLHGLYAEKPDGKQVIDKFRQDILNHYKGYAEDWKTGWMLDVEQQIRLTDDHGNEVLKVAADKGDGKLKDYAACPANGKLNILHRFETVSFVPIGNTPYEVKEVTGSFGPAPQKFTGRLDADGKASISGCTPNRQYRVTFYPTVGEPEMNALFTSYTGLLDNLHGWLLQEWTTRISAHWLMMSPVGDPRRLLEINQAFLAGVGHAMSNIIDDVKSLIEMLSDLDKFKEQLLNFISELDFQKLKEQAKDLLHTALMILHDEPLIFFFAATICCWAELLPPVEAAEMISAFEAGILLNILLGIVLSGGLGLAFRLSVKGLKKAVKVTPATDNLVDAMQGLIDISRSHALSAHAKVVAPLVASGSMLVNSSAKVPLMIKSLPQKINQVVEDALSLVRNKKRPGFRTDKSEAVDDASTTAKTPSGQPADQECTTCKHGEPVSMVSGEELLTLTDAALEGVLPFAWDRLYRTSAAELDCGLGFGWSHSLAQRLELEGERLVWTDHENRRTHFPIPSEQRPAITNRLARAAIYLGQDPTELILAQAGKTPRFYHFRRDAQGGYLIAISDAYGCRLNLNRDLAGRPRRLSGAGRALLLRYESSRIVAVDYQIQRPAENEEASWQSVQTLVSYQYNQQGQLVAASNALGETERYRYDPDNVILERQLAGGAAFYWEWQGQGKQARCVHHWANFGQMDARYNWDDLGGVTVVNADGSEETYVHDQNARLVRQVDPDGGETLRSYDDKGQLLAEQSPLGALTEYRYNTAGHLQALIPSEGEPTYYDYLDGHVRSVRRGEAIWKYERNVQGDITAQTDPLGQITHYRYDARGRLLEIRHPDGSQHLLVWNAQGELIEERLPGGGICRYRYDAFGRLITRQDDNGALTQYQWDAGGRLAQVTLPSGATRAYTYNPYGKITSERDEQGRVTRYEYADGLHLVSRRINPDGSQLRYRYDNARLLLTDIENERGEHYRLDYHPNGLISQETGFDGRQTAYRYDLAGHLIEKKEFAEDGSERITAYQRDSAGRLLVKTLADGEQIHYAYDGLGRLVGVDDGQWPLAYAYDLRDRLIEEHQGWATLRYEYDTLGQLGHCRLPDGSRLDYRYRPGGELTGIDLNDQPLTRHQFEQGRERYRRQGTLLSEYDYDDQGRLQAHRVRSDHRQLLQRQYRYDASGNLAAIEDSRKGNRSFHYDPLDRLVAVRGDLPESFAHDPAGTLLAQNTATPSGLANVKGNRLLMQGDSHYDYDAFGNLVRERRGAGKRLITEYQYDNQHRLIGASLPDGRRVQYRYDAFGRRIAKTLDGQTTEFLWQGERLIAESGPVHYRSYVYEPGTFRPLALLQGEGDAAEPCYYQLDHLGTPQELTSAGGQILWSVQYRAYGSLAKVEAAEVDNPLRFQGQYFDAETGLHYNRHRYYNPGTGSFLTPDPIKLAGGLNNYQYVPNPTGWVDQLGLHSTLGQCPGKDGQPVENPSAEANVDEGTPPAPSADEVKWTPHGYKHVPPKNKEWPEVVKSTKSGPAKYKPGVDIEKLERGAYEIGTSTTNGKPWKVQEYDEVIGASEGKPSRWIRVELSANTIHGHPISEAEFKRLKK
ncbi:type IV secretion protein Rhs [Pseudomonas sp. L-22-4S-12]|uniref:RHS repeat-associated core domain-containing protein n=1 Tax=Pseudomonas sp. L-22-4S-12 TaxID=2610893 RepID=UPI0013234690|nr:RHS repeat-associated core domain-containing protein [Pseudomonas sp. L-22-4S-12]MWV17459.1 type IV secretion protein Rhs [Pseudomonas sp. L-22-4S-12]